MIVKELRQILKVLGDDTRLKLVYFLSKESLTVKELCLRTGAAQRTVSKHLMKLRLLHVVADSREGNFMRYSFKRDSEHGRIIKSMLKEAVRAGVFNEE